MATAATDVLDALNWRYAVKAFSSQQVQPGDLRVLLEAARLSPSSYGLQPYQVIAISNRALREELIPHSYGQDKVLHSSHLLVFAAHTDVGDHTVERFVAQSKRALGLVPDSLESYAAHMKDALAKKSDAERLNWAKQQPFIARESFTVISNRRTSWSPIPIRPPPPGRALSARSSCSISASPSCAIRAGTPAA